MLNDDVIEHFRAQAEAEGKGYQETINDILCEAEARDNAPSSEHVPLTVAYAMTDPTVALLRDRLVSALAPRRIILFGSRARGTAQPDSDYDILVVAETDLPFEDRGFQARRAVRDVRVSKDIVVVTPDEFRKYSTWLTGVVREAVDHGEVLYEAA